MRNPCRENLQYPVVLKNVQFHKANLNLVELEDLSDNKQVWI